MTEKPSLRIVLAAICAAATIFAGAGPGYGFDLSRTLVPADEIVSGGPAKDGIPALTDAKFVTAAEAGFLADDDEIVGLALQGSDVPPRAYPVAILNWHEVVNDSYGNRPIVVTYCPLTRSAVVFDRSDGGRVRTFGVSGRLYKSNVLLYDRATESLWSQLDARALAGPSAGKSLAALPSVVMPWRDWRTAHPDTLVLSDVTGHERDYGRDPYAGYSDSGRLYFPVSPQSARLPPKELVIGIRDGKIARAYVVPEMESLGSVIEDVVDGVNVRIEHVSSELAAFVGGRQVPATRMYWFAWFAFHPETGVWPQVTADDPDASAIVRITETRSYWTSFMGGGGFMLQPESDPFEMRDGLFVVAGRLENLSRQTLDHVELLFELVDTDGNVVASREGFNRKAEALFGDAEEAAAIETIPAGGDDSYRMIFFGDEVPRFDAPRVSVRRAVLAPR